MNHLFTNTSLIKKKFTCHNQVYKDWWRTNLLSKTFAIIMILAGAVPISAQIDLTLSTPNTTVTCGETVTVSVDISAYTDLASITFSIAFDPAVLDFVSATGSIDGESATIGEPGVGPPADRVTYSWVSADFSSGSSGGPENVLTMVFTMLDGSATTSIAFDGSPTDIEATDGNTFSEIPVTLLPAPDGTINISGADPVISINAIPGFPFEEVCVGDDAAFRASPTAPGVQTYDWSFSGTPVFGFAGQTAQDGITRRNLGVNYDMSDVGPQTIDLTVTFTNGCTATAPQHTITVNPLPEVTCPADLQVCQSDGAIFLESLATTPPSIDANSSFSGPGVTAFDASEGKWDFDPAVAGIGNHTITYQFIAGNGCLNSCTFNINVNANPPTPVADVMTDLSCEGDTGPDRARVSVTLPGSSDDFEAIWIIGNNPAGISPGTGFAPGDNVAGVVAFPTANRNTARIATAAPVGVYEFCVRIRDRNSGCESSEVCGYVITVNPLIQVTCPADLQVCQSDGVVFLEGLAITPPSIDANSSFSGPGVTPFDASEGLWDFDPVVAGIGNHTITYQYDSGNGCVTSCTFNINVNANPADPVPDLMTDESCEGDTGADRARVRVELPGNSNDFEAIWIIGNNPAGISPGTEFAPGDDVAGVLSFPENNRRTARIEPSAPTGVYEFCVRIRDRNSGCESSEACGYSITINANPAAPVPDLLTDEGCEGDTGPDRARVRVVLPGSSDNFEAIWIIGSNPAGIPAGSEFVPGDNVAGVLTIPENTRRTARIATAAPAGVYEFCVRIRDRNTGCEGSEGCGYSITVIPLPTMTCPSDIVTDIDMDECTWTSEQGDLTPIFDNDCPVFSVIWEIELPSGTGPVATQNVAEWNFEDETKRVAPNLPYTADGGIAANVNIATVNLAGGPLFTAFVNGSGGGGTFAPNSNTWTAVGDKYWQTALSTVGFEELTVSSRQQSSNTGPRDFILEYSLDGTTWTTVPGGSITVANDFVSGVLSDVALPTACDNQTTLFLRWLLTSTTAVNGGTISGTGTNRIDDIVISGKAIDGGNIITGTDDASGIELPVGTSTVTYTVSDMSGNTTNCSFTVEVNLNPVCLDQEVTFNGEESIVLMGDELVEINENCDVEIDLSVPEILCDQVGQIVPVTVTLTDAVGNTASCVSNINVAGSPCGWYSDSEGINCPDGSSASFDGPTETWSVSSVNCYYANPFNSDVLAYAQNQICGDGSITAQVTSITGTSLGWAGIVMRENSTGGSKKAQLMTNMSNFSRREFRTITNGASTPQQFPTFNRYWLRLTRKGNQFTMHVSPNGANWFFVGAQNIVMANCIETGLVVTNYNSNSSVNATFSNVSVVSALMMNRLPGATTEFATMIESKERIDVNMYPNPANNEVWLDLSGYKGHDVNLEMIDLHGRTVRVMETNGIGTAHMHLGSVPAGVYMIKLKSKGFEDQIKRLVVNP